MKTGNREKKEEKLDISVSNHKTGFLNFLRFIAFTILVTFKNFVIRTLTLVLFQNIKKFANLWHLWASIYEAKLIIYRSCHLEVFSKKGVLRKFAKFTRKHLCRSVFFNKVASLYSFIQKDTLAQVFLKTRFW